MCNVEYQQIIQTLLRGLNNGYALFKRAVYFRNLLDMSLNVPKRKQISNRGMVLIESADFEVCAATNLAH